MKLLHDGDEFGIITSESDVEVARAAAETADSLRGLATAAGLTGEDRGECGICGSEAPLRPVAAETPTGPGRVRVCAECQDELVEDRLAAVEAEVDDEPEPQHTRTGDVIEEAEGDGA